MKIVATGETALRLTSGGGGLELATEGPALSPYHFLAASLATCVHLVLEDSAEQKGGDLPAALTLEVTWEMDTEGLVGAMELTVRWPGLPAGRREVVGRLAAACPIHGSLHRGTDLSVTVATEQQSSTEGKRSPE